MGGTVDTVGTGGIHGGYGGTGVLGCMGGMWVHGGMGGMGVRGRKESVSLWTSDFWVFRQTQGFCSVSLHRPDKREFLSTLTFRRISEQNPLVRTLKLSQRTCSLILSPNV